MHSDEPDMFTPLCTDETSEVWCVLSPTINTTNGHPHRAVIRDGTGKEDAVWLAQELNRVMGVRASTLAGARRATRQAAAELKEKLDGDAQAGAKCNVAGEHDTHICIYKGTVHIHSGGTVGVIKVQAGNTA